MPTVTGKFTGPPSQPVARRCPKSREREKEKQRLFQGIKASKIMTPRFLRRSWEEGTNTALGVSWLSRFIGSLPPSGPFERDP
ncbi:hypothetical protein WN55_04092 [Dufourea novaeangliae]|uniref:Uncharacterized protein n=1 Tax=Dufourea novaeangliae TaxID=178035 RepID=A0A154PKC9_DUFNO|nr:hypothetical protein WN55_04092 [Dufourea novaeangliae]